MEKFVWHILGTFWPENILWFTECDFNIMHFLSDHISHINTDGSGQVGWRWARHRNNGASLASGWGWCKIMVEGKENLRNIKKILKDNPYISDFIKISLTLVFFSSVNVNSFFSSTPSLSAEVTKLWFNSRREMPTHGSHAHPQCFPRVSRGSSVGRLLPFRMVTGVRFYWV